jgi:hypothetical protein
MTWLRPKDELMTLDRLTDNIVYQISLLVNSHGLDQEAAKTVISYNLKEFASKCEKEGFDWIKEGEK